MKYVVYFAIGWCLVCGFAGEALAYDGNELLGACQTFLARVDTAARDYMDIYKNGFVSGTCLGYFGGTLATAQIWQLALSERAQKSGGGVYCLPESEPKQMIRDVVKYLEDNPAELHKTAAFNILDALMEAFPCTEGN